MELRTFKEIVATSKSIRQCLTKLDWGYSGGSYIAFHKIVKQHNIDTTHFTGKQWYSENPKVQLAYLGGNNKTPTNEILAKDSPWLGATHTLKLRLIKEGYFEHKCYNCNLDTWLNSPIPIELEHKNGDKRDFRIENLTILCPNCHALTLTYRGRNIKR